MERSHRVTRNELYEMVWARPMIHVAKDLGITGNGLARACERLGVPYPQRGYWAKKQAGKPIKQDPLPALKEGAKDWTDITPPAPKRARLPEAIHVAAEVSALSTGLSIPDDMTDLHKLVHSWIKEHEKDQQERAVDHRRAMRERGWSSPLIPDLTERDRYRFRVTSAIFKGLEQAGCKIEQALVSGKATILTGKQKVEISVAEKMVRSTKSWQEARAWTAFSQFAKSGLDASGYLRVTINTWIPGKQPEWVESDKTKMETMLPAIIGGIAAMEPILERQAREREEQHQRYQEEESRRRERQRIATIDNKRWERFRQHAIDWNEATRIAAFITEVEAQAGETSDPGLKEWIAWARTKLDALNPLIAGPAAIFAEMEKITEWS